MHTKPTQNDIIYGLLVEGKTISTLEAMVQYGIGRLASRICDLTNDYGVPIQSISEKNADGKGQHSRYYISTADRAKLHGVALRDVHSTLHDL